MPNEDALAKLRRADLGAILGGGPKGEKRQQRDGLGGF